MSYTRTASTTLPHPQTLIHARDDLASFVERNADEILWIGGAIGGRNGRAAAADLVDAALSQFNDREAIHGLIIVLRDILRAGPVAPTRSGSDSRPDLDAALRWFGARLDDFAFRLA